MYMANLLLACGGRRKEYAGKKKQDELFTPNSISNTHRGSPKESDGAGPSDHHDPGQMHRWHTVMLLIEKPNGGQDADEPDRKRHLSNAVSVRRAAAGTDG